jgi:hypothetical protein
MSRDRSRTRGGKAGPAPHGKRARCVIACGAILTAALLLGHEALAGALAREAAKTGSGVATAPRNSKDARAAGIAERSAPTLIELRGEFTVADLIGQADGPLTLIINVPPHKPTDYMLLSFRGLPQNFSMTSGFRAAEAWLVSAHEAENLQLIAPKDYVGTFKLEVQLLRGQDAGPVVQNVTIELRPPTMAKRAGPAEGPVAAGPRTKPEPRVSPAGTTETAAMQDATPPVAAQAPKPAHIDRDREQQLMETAAGLLAQNDITAARLIYARLAREGSLRGALTMAQTYDPAFLASYRINGLQPDKEKAKYWYSVAANLGSKDASGRLLALEAADRR